MLVYFEGMLRFGVSWDGAVSMHGPNRNMAENLSDYNELHTLSSGRFFLRGTQEWSYGATVLTPQREEGLHEKRLRIEFLVVILTPQRDHRVESLWGLDASWGSFPPSNAIA